MKVLFGSQAYISTTNALSAGVKAQSNSLAVPTGQDSFQKSSDPQLMFGIRFRRDTTPQAEKDAADLRERARAADSRRAAGSSGAPPATPTTPSSTPQPQESSSSSSGRRGRRGRGSSDSSGAGSRPAGRKGRVQTGFLGLGTKDVTLETVTVKGKQVTVARGSDGKLIRDGGRIATYRDGGGDAMVQNSNGVNEKDIK